MQIPLDISLPVRSVRSPRTRRIARDFQIAAGRPEPLRILHPTTLTLSPGQLAYLVGASGSGKSQLLAKLKTVWPGPVIAGSLGRPPRRRALAVLDTLAALIPSSAPRGRARERAPLDAAIRLLSLAGLAEARLWLSPPDCLSAGQLDRLALAHLYARVEHRIRPRARDVLLLIDEFASRLDRLTAKVLAANLRRWLSRTPHVAVVVATAHDDLADALLPDTVWVKTNEGRIECMARG